MGHLRSDYESIVEGFTNSAAWIEANSTYIVEIPEVINNAFLAQLKPMGEFCLICNVGSKFSGTSETFHEILDAVWGSLKQGDSLLHLITSRMDVFAASTITADFFSLGYSNDRLFRMSRYVLSTTSCCSVELPYWRKIDILRARSYIDECVEFSPQITNCWHHNKPEPWIASDDIAYSLTHDIFYITDFGSNLEYIGDDDIFYLEIVIEAWIRIFDSNYDIVAELGIVAYCIGLHELGAKIAAIIAHHQCQNGMVPSPKHGGQSLIEEIRPSTESHEEFLRNYHTTYVSYLLFSMACSRIDRGVDGSIKHA